MNSNTKGRKTTDTSHPLGVWFPTIRCGTGTDVFTIRLAQALCERGIRSEITWLPHRAEYAPWSVEIPQPPKWATIAHINSWLHRRFIPRYLPLVVTLHHCVHDPAFRLYKNLPRTLYHRFWIKPCETYSIGRATAITAVSQYSANQVRAIFGRNDIDVIYNWIDTKIFRPDSRDHPHQPFRLLFVGKPSLRKGADLLPKIMRILGPDFELRYTGKPKDIGISSLPENMFPIRLLTDESAVADAYRNADALLFPTRLEGFGLVAIEAQACGIPVIATHGSSLPEVVEQEKTGILCPADCPEAFAQAAYRLRTRDEWLKFSTAARKRALTLFQEDISVNAWIRVYEKLMHGRV